MSLAPIILFTFNRLEHTKKTIESLKNNNLANESELFIYSDAARNNNEEKKVDLVRKYLKTISGFKSITIIESERNNGLAKSVIDGVSEVINKYNKVIVLEDDLISSKYFLEYMNEALDLYENRKDIWSIAGYSPKIDIPKEYTDDIYLIRRGASWGWSTWKDRWILNEWEILDYDKFRKNRKLIKEFNIGGSDMAPMLEDQMKGRINSWAIRWGYNQFKNDMWTIYPVKSLINNIGNDLSGTHTPITSKYDIKLENNKVILNRDVLINEKIMKSFKVFYDLSAVGYLSIVIKKIGMYRSARNLRNKILRLIR